MPLRLIASALLAIGLASSPALACKGSRVLLADDFKGEMDPAWNVVFGEAAAVGGKLHVKSEPRKLALVEYEGDFFPGADICVDIVAPNIKNATGVFAGISFTSKGSYYYGIRPDGSAGVLRFSGGWLRPVAPRKFEAVKTAIDAVNTIRIVWKPKEQAIQTFVNDQPFVTFKAMEANDNRKIGFYAETDGETVQFSNLKVTAPPR